MVSSWCPITNAIPLPTSSIRKMAMMSRPIIEFTTVADFSQFSRRYDTGEADELRGQQGAYFLDMETDADVVTVRNGCRTVGGVAAELGFFDAAGNNLAVNADNDLRLSA